jgi:hypothetical protein
MVVATQARRLDFSAAIAATAIAVASVAGLPSTVFAQKGSQPAAACTGPGPSGMVFAILDELCPVVAGIGTARIERDSNGERYIAATVNNINFAVDVYNCEPDCADLSFTASFEMDGLTIDQMNEWNSSRRFGKAYIRDDGDAVIQIAINTRHGISLETFRDDLVWWETVIEDYVEFIGFR